MNKKKILLQLIAILFLVSIGKTSAFGQDESDPLDLGEVISIGNRNLTLKDAYKFSTTPVIRDSVLEIETLDFLVSPAKGNTQFKVNSLKPATLKIVDPLPKYYRAYVLGGFGLYASPRGELYFNSIRNRNWNYGFEATHFSGNGGVKDVVSSSWGNTDASIWATRYLKKSSVKVLAGYENNIVHYYGGTPDLDSPLSKDQIAQKVNSANIGVSIRSFFRDTSKINYITNAEYTYLQDHYNTVENRVNVNGHVLGSYLNQYYDVGYVVDYNKTQSVVNTLGEPITDSLARINQENTVVGLNPAVDLHGDKWKVLAGVNMYFNNTKFHFYPRVEAYYELFDKLFIPYVGINGAIKKRTYGLFFKENPFIVSFPTLKNQNQKFYFYGGLKGKITKNISFNVNYSYEEVEDMALFVNDTLYSSQNRFTIRYDKVKVSEIYASLKYDQLEKLTVSLGGSFFNYSSSSELYAWQKPKMKINLEVDYNLSNKFLVGLNFYYVGQRKAASLLPVEGISPDEGIYVVDMKGFVDANLHFEYRYTQRLSGFVDINNMFSSKYDSYYLFQVQPFFAMLGASYSF